MNERLRALVELSVSSAREYIGLHEYDGRVQDLSPGGVVAALGRLGGPPEVDPYDEALVSGAEAALRYEFGELQVHRHNPIVHLDELDLSCYDREYAPAEERAAARRKHLVAWPDVVGAAIEALDRVPAAVADALLPAVRGLSADVEPGDPVSDAALAAHTRLVRHLEAAASDGDPSPALGRAALEKLLSLSEGMPVDLGRLEERADAERDRLRAMLAEACKRIAPGRPTGEVVAELLADHPDAEGVLEQARATTAEAIAFTAERELVPDLDGDCVVAPAPASRRWALAMMSWAAPYETDAPSRYYISPPEPDWPADQQAKWLEVFSRSTEPAITVHEVAPGHFAHGRMLRRVRGDARRCLQSEAFIEGWAHHCEELCVEEGFRDGDPRFTAGVALEALQRVTRLATAIGVHSGTMTIEESMARFSADAGIRGQAARAEAVRSTFDPTYGRYTWGKLEIRRLREEVRQRWGAGYSVQRFNAELLALGSPPLGFMRHAFDGTLPEIEGAAAS